MADAVDREDFKALKSELGDLLFQIVFHAEMADEKGIFNLTDVINELNDKLVRRHPHVFADAQAISSEESLTIWEDIKAEERKAQKLDSLMDDVPKNLPSLIRAKKLQKRAARIGFDWKDANKVINKIEEELEIFRSEGKISKCCVKFYEAKIKETKEALEREKEQLLKMLSKKED